MAFAIEFFLDEASVDRVREVWTQMTAEGFVVAMEGRPHITLGIWDEIDIEKSQTWLRDYATTVKPFEVRFASVGYFANDLTVVFLAPVVTAHLLDLQVGFQNEFRGQVGEAWSNFRPGWWVPHCTLAQGIERESFSEAMTLSREIELPFDAVLESIGIVEFPALNEHGTF